MQASPSIAHLEKHFVEQTQCGIVLHCPTGCSVALVPSTVHGMTLRSDVPMEGDSAASSVSINDSLFGLPYSPGPTSNADELLILELATNVFHCV